MTDRNQGHVLIVDDDDAVRTLMREIAEEVGLSVMECGDAMAVIGSIRKHPPEVIVLDLQMPGLDGVEVLRRLHDVACTARIVVASGSDPRVLSSAIMLGRELGLNVVGGLGKPLDLMKFGELLRRPRDAAKTITSRETLTALDDGALTAHFQPCMDLKRAGRPVPVGAEALVRWQDAERGLLLPDQFLPAIAHEKAMDRLTYWVFEHTARQMGLWRKGGLDLNISVNLDAQVLGDLELPDKLVEIAGMYGTPAERMTLEITERAPMHDTRNAMDILMRLRLKGFSLSIDDFGTGFSSLSELYRMPFSELKVDRSFVSKACESEEARIIVRSVVDLARNMGLRSCAEGVEDEETLDFLMETGCDRAQGFLFSDALPADCFEAFVERARRAA